MNSFPPEANQYERIPTLTRAITKEKQTLIPPPKMPKPSIKFVAEDQ